MWLFRIWLFGHQIPRRLRRGASFWLLGFLGWEYLVSPSLGIFIVRTAFIFLWVFMVTLQSYYSYSLNIAVPPVVAAILAMISLPWIIRKSLPKSFWNSVRKLVYIWVYFIFSGLVVSIFSTDIYYTRILAMPLYLAVGIFFCYLVVSDKSILKSAIFWVLQIHVVAFLLQAVVFYAGFGFIDYILPFTGEEQRAIGGSFYLDQGGMTQLIRPTGLHNEPGTYSNMVFVLFLIYKNLSVGKDDSPVIEYFDWILLFTIVASFSVFGMIYVSLYLMYTSARNFKGLVLLMISLLVLVPFVYEVYLYPRFFSGNYEDTGVEFRYEAVVNYLSYLLDGNMLSALFGVGLFTNVTSILGDFVWNDLGLLVYLFITVGFFGVVLLIFVSFKGMIVNRTIFVGVVFLLTKISISTIFFWFVMAFLIFYDESVIAKSDRFGRVC